MCLSLCTWNYFFTVSGLSCGQKDVSKAIMTSITVVNKIFNKNNLTVNLTLLLFSPAECLWRGCQRSSRISICPLGELNSSLGLQIPSLFLMCPTGIAGKIAQEAFFSCSDGKLVPVSDFLCISSWNTLSFTLFSCRKDFWKYSLFSPLFCSPRCDMLEDIKQQDSKEDMFCIILLVRTLWTCK